MDKTERNKQNLFQFNFKAEIALIYLFDYAISQTDALQGTLRDEVNLSHPASISYIYDGIKLMQISRYTLFVWEGISYKIARSLPPVIPSQTAPRVSDLEVCKVRTT